MITRHYRIELTRSGPERGTLRFAFLTDLHGAENGPDNRILLEALEQERPDALLCGGDMIVGKPGASVRTALSLMERMARRWPVYHALGNHEYRTRIYPETYPGIYAGYAAGLERMGVRLLDNASASFTVRGIPVTVWGYTMDRYYYHRWKRRKLPEKELREALSGTPDGKGVSLLLAHNPAQMDTYFRWGADVTLCGHYHGGIVGLGRHKGLISPDFRLFPDAHGLFERNGRYAVISAGLGEHTLPLRIGNPRELVVLELNVREAAD